MGGHAAGEKAAETARDVLRARLERQVGAPEQRLREAIALANNEIYSLAASRSEYEGMACVLTALVIGEEEAVAGHVGDSRLYLLTPGGIRKLTRDHSPVGEREDSGDLSEAEAMRHPRRNEVYRDVGTAERAPEDPDFIDILHIRFPQDAALLLCSDGLSDLVSSERIRTIVEERRDDLNAAARALVAEAGAAGGKDNISVILIARRGYVSHSAQYAVPAVAKRGWRALIAVAALLFALAAAGAFWFSTRAKTWVVGPGSPDGFATISAGLDRARAGDTVRVLPGVYAEQVRLKEGVSLISADPGAAAIQTAGVAVTANTIGEGRIGGFRIGGEGLETGLLIVASSIVAENLLISGARNAGIDIHGASAATIRNCQVVENAGPGILVRESAAPVISFNSIRGNGSGPQPRPGIEILPGAKPVIDANTIVENAAEGIWAPPLFEIEPLLRSNYFGVRPSAPPDLPKKGPKKKKNSGVSLDRRVRVVVP
jgi:parallel beta-helix repeat protein